MARVLQLPIVKKKSEIAGETERELFPVPLRLFKPGQAPPCTIYFKSLAGGRARGGDSGDLANCRFTQSLPGDGDAWGYYDPADAGPLLAYLSGRLEEAGTGPLAKAHFIYDTAVVWMQHFFHSGTLAPAQLHLAEALMPRLYNLLKEAGPREVIRAVRRHDSGLFTHSVNVCLLGLAFVRHLGWPEQEAEIFGLGALLHDLGMIALPRDTWTKTGPLTVEEREAIKTHPLNGVQLLENFADLPGTIFYMVAQHHESDDGSGYPLGLPERAIHPWARLLKILDTYEAITSIRPWRAPLSSPKALKVLQHGAGPCSLAPTLLASFQEFLGGDLTVGSL